ncbi:MAG TPA: peptidylprolyl isomerase [Bryobacteraceae bacterium]|nr:peptidylprolyl isomerase [Bryobacteraceae bacterium]
MKLPASLAIPFFVAAVAFGQQPAPAQTTPPQAPALQSVTPSDSSVAPDAVVISIGAENITRAQFEQLLSALASTGKPMPKTAAQKRQVAEQYAELETMAQEARKRKLEDDGEIKQLMGIQNDGVLANALVKRIGDDTHFTDLDLRSYYDSHKGEFEEAKGSHILIRFKGAAGAPAKPGEKELTDAEALAKVQDLRKQILAGADFATLAKANSEDPGSAVRGGELGTFRHGQMVAPFDQAAFTVPVGQVSEPVKTQFGYHLIKIESRTSKTFDEVKPQIEKDLKPKMTRDAIDQIKAHTSVTLNDTYFGATPSGGPQTLPVPAPPAK